MKRWIIGIVSAALFLVAGVLAIGWSVLAIPYFSNFRSTLVAELLTEQIGQPLLVNGDVSVRVNRVSRVHASGVRIPSENMQDVDLASLERLEFDIDLLALWRGKIDLNNLLVDELQVQLIRHTDGTQSWSEREQQAIGSHAVAQTEAPKDDATVANADANTEGDGLLAFLKTRTVDFSDIRLIIDDQISGFEYDFDLKELSLAQLEEGLTLGVTSTGTVNGHSFSLEGNYPEAAPFTTKATFSSAEFAFDGVPVPTEEGGGFEGDFNLEIKEVRDLLDVLKLKGQINGTAKLSAKVINRVGDTALADVSAVFELGKGQRISLAGDVADIGRRAGFDLEFDARLFPENLPPPRADGLDELQLTGVSTRIISQNRNLELDDMLVSTNAFQHGLDRVGPVSIGQIRRTENGTLAFQDIKLQAGPVDSPHLKAEGNIFNILELKEIDFAGSVNAPASLVLASLGEDVAEAFGGVVGSFAIDDASGTLGINQLSAKTVNTDVWDLTAEISVADVATLGETKVDIDIGIENSAEFLTALRLKPVDAGKLSAALDINGNEGTWTGEVGLGAGQSELTGTVEFAAQGERKKTIAAIISEAMVMSDLKNAIAGAFEIRKIGEPPEPADNEPDIELQPLVLPTEETETAERDTEDQTSDVEIQPLVIARDEDKILDPKDFLRETDIYGKIDFKEISGIDGITRVSSDFVSEGGKARLGPLEFNYGGGYFNFQANADVVEAPQFVSVSGATSGWNLADILSTAGVEFDAKGALSGRFDISGNLDNIQTYMNSMRGSASIDMSNGQIATSLLELAGLGVFPWLFSQERRQVYRAVQN